MVNLVEGISSINSLGMPVDKLKSLYCNKVDHTESKLEDFQKFPQLLDMSL